MEFYSPQPEAALKKERVKARELKKSGWWKSKLNHGECYYCGKKFAPSELTMDHKVPLARGGKSSRSNIVPCCKPCNSEKGSQTAVSMELLNL